MARKRKAKVMSTSAIEIAAMYEFESESSPGKMYEALLYVDGSTSCNCKGWTMKKRTTKTETQGNLAPRSGSRRFNLD